MLTMQQCFFLVLLFPLWLSAQNAMKVNARLVDSLHTIEVDQQITFVNTEERELVSIYLNDWNNAFSSKTSPLARTSTIIPALLSSLIKSARSSAVLCLLVIKISISQKRPKTEYQYAKNTEY